jgi:hypothetical protein
VQSNLIHQLEFVLTFPGRYLSAVLSPHFFGCLENSE